MSSVTLQLNPSEVSPLLMRELGYMIPLPPEYVLLTDIVDIRLLQESDEVLQKSTDEVHGVGESTLLLFDDKGRRITHVDIPNFLLSLGGGDSEDDFNPGLISQTIIVPNGKVLFGFDVNLADGSCLEVENGAAVVIL